MINEQADNTIRNHALWAAGGGLIPIPVIDFMAVTTIQLDMLQNLCAIYTVDYRRNEGKSIISALVGTTVASLGASLVKAIPGIGSVLGGVSMSVMSGATTYAIGQVFAEHFEQGGTLDDLDAENFRRFYKQKVEEGKKIVEELRKKDKETPSTSETTPQQQAMEGKLADLQQLLRQGVISQAEYDQMRRKIIEDFIG